MHRPLAPVHGPGCRPAPPSEHWYGGLGVSFGDSEGWKPQKMGGCGWARCPRVLFLSHIAQDTARSWFWACWTQTVHIHTIFAIFWPFLKYIVELEANKWLFVMRQSRRTCSVATVSLCLSVLSVFRDCFGPTKSVLGHKMRGFGREPPELVPPPRGASVEFLAQNLDLATAAPRL